MLARAKATQPESTSWQDIPKEKSENTTVTLAQQCWLVFFGGVQDVGLHHEHFSGYAVNLRKTPATAPSIGIWLQKVKQDALMATHPSHRLH